MPWMLDDGELDAARERALKAMSVPVGAASPLWLAFGAAAGAGVAWWWMTRWARAVNIEAMMGHPPSASPLLSAPPPTVEEIPPAPEPAPAEISAKPDPEPEQEPAAAAEPAPPEPDDLTRLMGIGPKLAAALAARGVTHFAHLAAWTAKDLAAFDAALGLKGRAVRDAWVAQAKRLSAEG